MPVRKGLRYQVVAPSAHARQRPCRWCNNLDPRGHPGSVYHTESSKGASASLDLVLDGLALAKTKDPAEGGCRFCGVLVQALDAVFESWRGCRQRINVELKETGSVKVGIDSEIRNGYLVEIYAESASRAPWPTLGTAHHIPLNAGSDDTFNFARRCIQDCLTNPKHSACKLPSRYSGAGPKRLLDVGRVTAPIRLVDTQGKTFQYATLSHCWGKGPAFTAVKTNWQKLASNIPFDTLPPLFQDAVIITRQLGLRYIWIDSLCIIQDSVRDWETESSKMGAIYENSYVTISAVNSGDGSHRCLVDRQKPVRLHYENTMSRKFALRARRTVNHHPDVERDQPARLLGPLTSRAWALQEHVLSTRILHYTATEVLFECKTSYRCECLPSRKPYSTTPALIPKAVAKRSRKHAEIWRAWHHVVEQYSTRYLTVPNDKLPAISGMASKIKDATTSSYIAGLWKDNLASDLLWSTLPASLSNANRYALDVYRAPSFSWASLDAPVSYYDPDADERENCRVSVTLLSSCISATGLNPLGAVSHASLELRAPILRALLSSSQESERKEWQYSLLIKGTSPILVSHDCYLVEEDFSTHSGKVEKTIRRANTSNQLTQFKSPVLCLSIARYDDWISGLVLGVSRQDSALWERLGTFAAGTEVFQNAEETVVHII